MTRATRARIVEMAISINERTIGRHLDRIEEAGEPLLDPNDSATVELREHCRRESEQIERERVERPNRCKR